MSRNPTPPPEGRLLGLGGPVAAVFSVPGMLLWVFTDIWWPAICLLTLPLILYAVFLIYSIVLLLAAWWRWRGTLIRGILVFSDSPNWRDYIEKNWLPRLNGQVVVLNWSERATWRKPLEVRLFHRFGLAGENRNFNPLVIRFRGLRYPLVYRYFFAFRDATHSNPEALQELERHMFAQFES